MVAKVCPLPPPFSGWSVFSGEPRQSISSTGHWALKMQQTFRRRHVLCTCQSSARQKRAFSSRTSCNTATSSAQQLRPSSSYFTFALDYSSFRRCLLLLYIICTCCEYLKFTTSIGETPRAKVHRLAVCGEIGGFRMALGGVGGVTSTGVRCCRVHYFAFKR